MNEASFTSLSAWLTQAGLAGSSETDEACAIAGLDKIKDRLN
jgi:hypothetical protein